MNYVTLIKYHRKDITILANRIMFCRMCYVFYVCLTITGLIGGSTISVIFNDLSRPKKRKPRKKKTDG